MARPRKMGLDYFPFDVDFFSDKKIKRLRAKFGTDGIAVYMYLLCEVYRSGYYIEYDEDLILDISDELNISENETTQIMNYLFSRSLLQLLESKLAIPVKVLTAASIQRRYQSAKKGGKKDIEVEAEFWVLNENETESFIKVHSVLGFSENNDSFSEKNTDKSENYDSKESKVKKSKEKYSKGEYHPVTDKPSQPPDPSIGINDILNLYHDICKSFPVVKAMSDARKKCINARLRNYKPEDFETVFRKAEASDFLKGKNNRNWSATFDWLMKDANFAKVLDGNYDNKLPNSDLQHDSFDISKYEQFINQF